jgi:hypothetical protein
MTRDNSNELPVKISQRQMHQIARMAAERAADILEERMRTKPLFLTTEEAAKVLALSPASLRQMRYEGTGPAFVRMGEGPKSPIRYPRDSVHMWAWTRTRQHATREETVPVD